MLHRKRISVKSSASLEEEIKSFILAKKAKGLADKTFAEAAWDEEFRHYLPYIRDDDFLVVQNYTRTQYGPEGQLPCPEGAELTQMDYEFYPEALVHVIRRVHEDFKGDLIVTENGVAVSDDSRRVEFIRRALRGVSNCVNDGIPVKGYMYWSLMDNFEWQKGFFHDLRPDRGRPRHHGAPSQGKSGVPRQAKIRL